MKANFFNKPDFTRLTSTLVGCKFSNFEHLPGTDAAFTVCRKFAFLDGNLRYVSSDREDFADVIDANSLEADLVTLLGPTGCGKTHLAAATLQARLQNDEADFAEYWQVADLLRTLKQVMLNPDAGSNRDDYNAAVVEAETGVKFSNSYNGIIRRLCGETRKIGTHFLVLDDLGVEKYTEWAEETLTLIVDRRYQLESNTPTLFTTNNIKQLPARIASRLKSGIIVPMNKAGDYRAKQGIKAALKAIYGSKSEVRP